MWDPFPLQGSAGVTLSVYLRVNWGLLSSCTCSVNITLNFAPISYFIEFSVNLILSVDIRICSIWVWSLPTVQYQILEECCYLETFFNHQNHSLKESVGLPFLCQLFHAKFKSHIQLFDIKNPTLVLLKVKLKTTT